MTGAYPEHRIPARLYQSVVGYSKRKTTDTALYRLLVNRLFMDYELWAANNRETMIAKHNILDACYGE